MGRCRGPSSVWYLRRPVQGLPLCIVAVYRGALKGAKPPKSMSRPNGLCWTDPRRSNWYGHSVRRGTIGEDGAHSREEHAPGAVRSKAGFCTRVPLPTARQGSAGRARSRFCEPAKNHTSARLLLASSFAMFYRAFSEVQAGLLGPET